MAHGSVEGVTAYLMVCKRSNRVQGDVSHGMQKLLAYIQHIGHDASIELRKYVRILGWGGGGWLSVVSRHMSDM